mmetsp:Transcript_17368/g.29404  ORF Transcript_17368/g.29404 Transcript_17368/m.29404 type:complete len:204 (+) Transcript_17368:1257-1868(+)
MSFHYWHIVPPQYDILPYLSLLSYDFDLVVRFVSIGADQKVINLLTPLLLLSPHHLFHIYSFTYTIHYKKVTLVTTQLIMRRLQYQYPTQSSNHALALGRLLLRPLHFFSLNRCNFSINNLSSSSSSSGTFINSRSCCCFFTVVGEKIKLKVSEMSLVISPQLKTEKMEVGDSIVVEISSASLPRCCCRCFSGDTTLTLTSRS